MTQEEAYQYYTGCKNGLQMDCFAERFEDSKPAMESYIERGLVSPRNMVVLDSPDARKYNLEKCASNVSEEKKLAEGWKDAQWSAWGKGQRFARPSFPILPPNWKC